MPDIYGITTRDRLWPDVVFFRGSRACSFGIVGRTPSDGVRRYSFWTRENGSNWWTQGFPKRSLWCSLTRPAGRVRDR